MGDREGAAVRAGDAGRRDWSAVEYGSGIVMFGGVTTWAPETSFSGSDIVEGSWCFNVRYFWEFEDDRDGREGSYYVDSTGSFVLQQASRKRGGGGQDRGNVTTSTQDKIDLILL